MKLVKFDNGTFGVRARWFFGWSFVDLRHNAYTWGKGSSHFKDCQGTETQARHAFVNYNLKSKHTVIEE